MQDTRMKSRRSRALRTRAKLRRSLNGRPRLSIFRSSKHIYAQVIDDARGHTLAAASTLEAALREGKSTSDSAAAEAVGKEIAERSLAQGVSEVTFDRGAYRYHGRMKALADAARAAGLVF